MSIFNNLYGSYNTIFLKLFLYRYDIPIYLFIYLWNIFQDVNMKYADYWNPVKRSEDNIYFNYMTTYSKNALSPLDILSRVMILFLYTILYFH